MGVFFFVWIGFQHPPLLTRAYNHSLFFVPRRVLVPLSGQYENMLLHDAYLVRKDMEKRIPQQYHGVVFQKAANVFLKEDKPKYS
jgi:hypothetical protein